MGQKWPLPKGDEFIKTDYATWFTINIACMEIANSKALGDAYLR
jgi:hypothetical protein